MHNNSNLCRRWNRCRWCISLYWVVTPPETPAPSIT